ncbi:Mannosylfructose-phosphate synthase [Planctomycetes bacterium Pla163]|uniref:Mannosylfructose-phosphate synthase n=1 Tax=Rohdeia mirabilis TaxID=2528008 RepID=A0A518D076_9BACT|nr:Mannosylfructose-phosphate synthase [Planctomycetes bacterium Pla163]
MKLLFLTQILDREDGILGFVPRWIEGLAQHCESVRVVALAVGDDLDLPTNVDAVEIGRKGRVRRFMRYHTALGDAFDQGYDTVLAHMVPRYALLAATPARRRGAGLYLWYTHKGVDDRLRRAERLVRKIFTASEESLRLETPKRVVTGHGIDVAHFAPLAAERRTRSADAIELLGAGRLTPAKDPESVLDALAQLVADGIDARLTWAGGGLAAGDDDYADGIRARVDELGLGERVRWLGHVPYPQMPDLYRAADVLVNSSHTGSVDKVVLEAMACGVAPVTCNESFERVFASLPAAGAAHRFEKHDARSLAAAVRGLTVDRGPSVASSDQLREVVVRDHEVDTLMARLVREMEPARRSRA